MIKDDAYEFDLELSESYYDELPINCPLVNEVYSAVIPSEDAWISCYDHSPSDSAQSTSSGSLHTKVHVELDEEDREKVVLKVREGDLRIEEAERRDFNQSYVVSSPSLRVPHTALLFPVQEYVDPERTNPQKPHRITAFSLAADKSHIPISNYPYREQRFSKQIPYFRNVLSVQFYVHFATANHDIFASGLKAHKSTVTSLRFFPSSRVLLSSGADFTLQIYPADPISTSAVSSGQTSKRVSSVRTLSSHIRSVTSTAMIGRGRAIISASMDGTIRIWNVSTGEEEALVHSASGMPIPLTNGTLYAALHDGSFEVLKLDGSKKPPELVHEFRSERSAYGPLSTIAVSSSFPTAAEKFIAVGSTKGVISVYNASTYAPVLHFRRSEASIETLAFASLPGDSPRLGLVIATADGLPWVAELHTLPQEKATVYAELAGGDVDPVRAVSVHTMSNSEVEVWTASDDGIVRRYVL
ncbi:WD40 repeat-like protein [Gymnopus androsaceus JB14]|uniref:WD40 repeat-like protein n=1 Tax=Gymnopus androsaceus JB14 TaxID=1447944 RepID=A0A6A4H559_9AGAR|nr:WD40 repeat-like protein [Gymnopus androsaceus JB14]